MSKEKQIQKIESEQLIEELSKMPPMVIATAYLHAINYTLYGVDVTEKWTTATQNLYALEKAYRKGYCDALQERAERASEQEPILDKISTEIELHRRKTESIDPYDLVGDCLDIIEKVRESTRKYKKVESEE